MDEKEYITEEKKAELEAELLDLQTTQRKEILESLAFAKSLGDLSENAEYHHARERQSKLEERVGQIEHILKNSVVFSSHHSNKVDVGITVVVQKRGTTDQKTYQMVGPEEVDMNLGKISYKSPIGQALFGKEKGDSVSFESPNGTIVYDILEVK